jgi:hypothetical protein
VRFTMIFITFILAPMMSFARTELPSSADPNNKPGFSDQVNTHSMFVGNNTQVNGLVEVINSMSALLGNTGSSGSSSTGYEANTQFAESLTAKDQRRVKVSADDPDSEIGQ